MYLVNSEKWVRLFLILTVILVVGMLAGCRSGQWLEYRLFCGLSFEHGAKEVSAEEWERFCDEVVVPEFPEGFTVYDGSGRWLQDGKVPVREKTKILLILAPDSNHAHEAVDRIAARYRERFQQESVLIVRQNIEAEFK